MADSRPNIVIVGGVRSPFCGCGGALSGQHPASLASYTLSGLLERVNVEPGVVDAVIAGCASQAGGQAINIARAAALGAGWPESISAVSINAQQSSGVESILMAAGTIAAGVHRFVIAGGVEHMSQVPLGLPLVDQHLGAAYGPDVADRYAGVEGLQPPGVLADQIATGHGATRELIESYATASRTRALSAQKDGLFQSEIGPWPTGIDLPHAADELASAPANEDEPLLPWFSDTGAHTAATVAPPADGASFVALTSADSARRANLEPAARVAAVASVGARTDGRELGAVAATKLALERTEISIDEIDILEVDEAFASTPVVWNRTLNVEVDHCNAVGGALSLGNPLGAAGARMAVSAITQLERTTSRYAMVVTNGVHGAASALVVER